MLNEKQTRDLFQSISKTAAKALRTLADELESAENPGQLARIAGEIHSVSFRSVSAASEWMNSERKAA